MMLIIGILLGLKIAYKIFPIVLFIAVALRVADIDNLLPILFFGEKKFVSVIRNTFIQSGIKYIVLITALSMLVIVSGNYLYLLLIFAGYPIIFRSENNINFKINI